MNARNDQEHQSDVGSDALENIITFLPIKETTKLSTLSKRFRHSWKFCRNLSFDRSVLERLSKDEFKTLINNFFHRTLIHKADKFSLYFDSIDEEKQLEEWIQQAVALGITELELDLSLSSLNNVRFAIHHDLIGRNLKRLKLVNCEIQFPPIAESVDGYFCHLRELTMQDALISHGSLEFMLLNCPSLTSLEMISCHFVSEYIMISAHGLKRLQKLVLIKCSEIGSISIDFPLMTSFHYNGKLTEFVFLCNELPQLNDVIFDMNPSRGFMSLPRRNELMVGLEWVRILTISSTFLEGLSSRFEENVDLGWGLNIWLWRLMEFNLDVATESYTTPTDVIEFLKKCPRIKKLKIVLANNSFKNSVFWDVVGRRYANETTLNLPHFKTIKMTGFTYNELPVTMSRFFVKNCQQLRDLILVKAKHNNFPKEFTPNHLRQGLPSPLHVVNIEVIEHRRDTTNTD